MLNDIVRPPNQFADQVTIRENKLSLVERLADDLAHEIKNPLHSMVINLEVLRRRLSRLEDQSGEDLLRYTGILNSELERVNRRVDLLLRMVRPNREEQEPTTLAEVFDELLELVELECERHEVALHMAPPVESIRARVPRASARQMILSLILKTLDSVPPGGSLHVRFENSPQWLRIHFQGLDDQRRVTSPDHTLENGSYLAVARELAERLGGSVEIGGEAPGVSFADSSSYILSLPGNRSPGAD